MYEGHGELGVDPERALRATEEVLEVEPCVSLRMSSTVPSAVTTSRPTMFERGEPKRPKRGSCQLGDGASTARAPSTVDALPPSWQEPHTLGSSGTTNPPGGPRAPAAPPMLADLQL